MKPHEKYRGVFTDGKNLFTKSPKGSLFGERIIRENKIYYRFWDPYRSKFSASLHRNLKNYFLNRDSRILYLGASFGNTVSFLSDICYEGKIYGVEFAIRPFSSLLNLSNLYTTIYPIMADANYPERYKLYIEGPDIIIQDISQKNQVEIFNKNMNEFPEAKYGFLFLKIRAIDAVKDPRLVLEESLKNLEDVREIINLNPYAKDHYLILIKR